MKRAVSFILALAVLLALLPVQAFASSADDYWSSVIEKIEGSKKGGSSEGGTVPGDIIDAMKDKDTKLDPTDPGEDYETPRPKPGESSPDEKLATPTDLQWGMEYRCTQDENGEWQYTSAEVPGMISWRNQEPYQDRFEVCIYTEDDEKVGDTRWRGVQEYLKSDDLFLLSDLESGAYYFTVQALGDGTKYTDSDVATSDLWTYTAPEAQLPQVDGLRWGEGAESRNIYWDDIDAPDGVSYGYEIQYLYTPSPDEEPYFTGSTWFRTAETEDMLDDWTIEGAGYYYFKVRALSNNIEVLRNGPWSELCGPYDLTEISGSLEETLEDILLLEDRDEILSAAKELNRDDLSAAMLADTDNSGIVDIVRELEAAAGVSTQIEVADGMQNHFSVDHISVAGAGLNLPAGSEDRAVTFHIGEPDEGVVIPTIYHNTVQFSMELENVEPELSFPVKITLPVPASINPDFLVILHYHQDGSYEEIHPILSASGGVHYASFAVTSFSTFVMAENNPEQPDDFGLNEENQSGILSGLPVGITPAWLEAHYRALGKDVSVQAPDGTTPKCVGTGCEVRCGGATYRVLLYGDLIGDGTIDVVDLLQIKSSVLGIRQLSDLSAKAADLNRNGETDIADLLLLKKHILGISTIQQTI
ncbi:dockerin type I repeat-containing protein [Ligaoa zhengdingensis]|uniref:dockerin type I repeat-containing protein n=1 Tax=Ligaoa zhengdingensis TaxID=2763658 RepID=UPI0031B9D86F